MTVDIRAALPFRERFQVRSLTNPMTNEPIPPSEVESLLKVLSVIVLRLRDKDVSSFEELLVENFHAAENVMLGIGLTTEEELMSEGGMLRELLVVALSNDEDEFKGAVKVFVKNMNAKYREDRLKHDRVSFDDNHIQIFNAIRTLMNKPDSEASYTTLRKRITSLGDKNLTRYFAEAIAVNDQEDQEVVKSVKQAYRRLLGLGSKEKVPMPPKLTTEQREELKQSNKEGLKAYDAAVRALKEKAMLTLRKAVMDSGEEMLTFADLEDVIKNMKLGFRPYDARWAQAEFLGLNSDGVLSDTAGNTYKRGLNLGPEMELEINHAFDPHNPQKGATYAFKVKTDNSVNRFMPVVIVNQNKSNKFGRAADNLENIEERKANWRRGFTHGDDDINDQTKVFSFMAEFLYWTAIRISSGEGQTRDKATGETKQTFGATSLKLSHITRAKTGSIRFRFPGKDGQPQDITLTPNIEGVSGKDKAALGKLIEFLQAKMKGKKKEDYLWTIDMKNKGIQRMPSHYFNTWLKQRGIGIVKAHDFRTLRGNEIASELLSDKAAEMVAVAKGSQLSEKEVKTAFIEVMTSVGKSLGHFRGEEPTAKTAIGSYIDPHVMMDFFSTFDMRPPQELTRLLDQTALREYYNSRTGVSNKQEEPQAAPVAKKRGRPKKQPEPQPTAKRRKAA